jgi:uncharacterized Rmd1/YagE family protein
MKHVLILTHCPLQGKVDISRNKTTQLLGELFLQRSAITLLSTLMDRPDFFRTSPDQLQVSRPIDLQLLVRCRSAAGQVQNRCRSCGMKAV